MTLEVAIVTAPAGWASALINGDESSFDYYNDPQDRSDYERFLEWLEASSLCVVSINCACGRDDGHCDVYPDECPVQESRFTNNGHVYHSSYSGVDVVDYVCHRINARAALNP